MVSHSYFRILAPSFVPSDRPIYYSIFIWSIGHLPSGAFLRILSIRHPLSEGGHGRSFPGLSTEATVSLACGWTGNVATAAAGVWACRASSRASEPRSIFRPPASPARCRARDCFHSLSAIFGASMPTFSHLADEIAREIGRTRYYLCRVFRSANNVCTVWRQRAASYRFRRLKTPLSRLISRRKQWLNARVGAMAVSVASSMRVRATPLSVTWSASLLPHHPMYARLAPRTGGENEPAASGLT
jgi:hypothetical protein